MSRRASARAESAKRVFINATRWAGSSHSLGGFVPAAKILPRKISTTVQSCHWTNLKIGHIDVNQWMPSTKENKTALKELLFYFKRKSGANSWISASPLWKNGHFQWKPAGSVGGRGKEAGGCQPSWFPHELCSLRTQWVSTAEWVSMEWDPSHPWIRGWAVCKVHTASHHTHIPTSHCCIHIQPACIALHHAFSLQWKNNRLIIILQKNIAHAS